MEGKKLVELGCGPSKPEGTIGVDIRPFPGVDVIADLTKGWPFKNSSLDAVRASHIFEHLPEPLHTMEELYRVLKPGGSADIEVPSTNGPGAFQDPTHKSFWNLNSFIYYNRQHGLGGMYGCNKWDIPLCQEYLVPGIESFGPYVMAQVRKPADASIDAD